MGHGDHREALRRIAAGDGETYHAQRHSIESVEALAGGDPLLVVSLDAPAYEEACGRRTLVGVGPVPRWLARPRRLAEAFRSHRVRAALARFAPTHVLLRAMDVVGCNVLAWTTQRGIPSAAIVAGRFDAAHPPSVRFCRLANHPSVAFVGNHNRIATASMIPCGLDPQKAVAWDWPPALVPDGKPPRVREHGTPLRLVFAGSLLATKGVLDLADAAAALARSGVDVRLEMLGDGPEAERLAAHPAARAGILTLPGRASHDAVLEAIARSDVAVVPSHPEFPEGLPVFIYEALALRVPVVLTAHPVFRAYFREGEGVCFAPPADGAGLARVLAGLAADGPRYVRISEATAHAWHSIQCEVRHEDLLGRLAVAWREAPCTS